MAYVSFKVTETYSHGLEGFTGGSGQSLAVTQNSVLSPAAAEQHQLLLPDLGLRIFFFFVEECCGTMLCTLTLIF